MPKIIISANYVILRHLPAADRFRTHCITSLIYRRTSHARENSIYILGGAISSVSGDGGQGGWMYMENDLEQKRNWLFLQGLNARIVILQGDAMRLEEGTDIRVRVHFSRKSTMSELQYKYK